MALIATVAERLPRLSLSPSPLIVGSLWLIANVYKKPMIAFYSGVSKSISIASMFHGSNEWHTFFFFFFNIVESFEV